MATRRVKDQVKRHVPHLSVHDGELISTVLQPRRLNSAMWHSLSELYCVRSKFDLLTTPNFGNMRHSLTNQITQVISNLDAPCTGPEYLVANWVYSLDSIFTSFFPSDFVYMCLFISPRHDEFVLISNMPFISSIFFLLMLFLYAFEIALPWDLFSLRYFNFCDSEPPSYVRLKSQTQFKYLIICWSLCLNTKSPLMKFSSKSFQVKDCDSKSRINRVRKFSLDLRFAKNKLFGHFNSTTSSHRFKPIMFPAETEQALIFNRCCIMPHDFKSIMFPTEGRNGLINSLKHYIHINRT